MVGDFEGYLHWLDKATGEIVARQKTDGERITNAAVTTDAGVFVQTDSGKLLAFKSQPKPQPSPDAMPKAERAQAGEAEPSSPTRNRMAPRCCPSSRSSAGRMSASRRCSIS